VIASLLVASLGTSPVSHADSASSFSDAISTARGADCPLRLDPTISEAADILNRSTDDYLSHTARAVPVADPLPLLKDLGYGGTKAKQLIGTGPTDADAIKGALLEGYEAIPDCSYTEFGVSVRWNEPSGYYLTLALLAGN
jgi:hypothetical protein